MPYLFLGSETPPGSLSPQGSERVLQGPLPTRLASYGANPGKDLGFPAVSLCWADAAGAAGLCL